MTFQPLQLHLLQQAFMETLISHRVSLSCSVEDMEIAMGTPELLIPGHHDELQVQENQQSTSEDPDLDFEEEIELEIEDILQHEVGSFLVNLKDSCYATQKILNEVIKGVDGILEIYLDWIESRFHKKFSGKEYISLNEVSDILKLMKGLSIFQGAHDTISFLEDTGRLVKPVKVVFQTRNVLTKDCSIVQEDEEFAYKVPFLPQLETFLNCDDVLECVDNPRQATPGTYKSLLDGSFYQEHPVVRYKDPKALAVVLHIDGAEMSDSASPRAGLNNLTNISWQLANVHPELGSTDRTINLLATIKTRWLSHERVKVLLEDIIDAMKKLTSSGVTLNIKGCKRHFYGLLLAVLGDYPAQGFIGGFKESVTATLVCRCCLAPNPDHLHECDIKVFSLRTLQLHEDHLKEIESYEAPKGRRAKPVPGQPHPDPSVRYGVNYRSHLMDIPHFDVTKCLLQDVMHIGPEGLLEMVCRSLMHHVILEKKKKLLTDVNDEISALSKCFRNDRPSSVNKPQHLTNKLRQSAAQMNNLAILLPFVLRKDSLFPGEAAYLQVHIRLLRILNLCMAYDLKNEDAERLSTMISDFHSELLKIKPDLSMAKIHFIHHLPEQVYSFGVIRQQACYRFESHFAILKRIARLLHNTKNLTMSIAYRHQTRQCQAMVQPGGFLYKGHEFGKRTKISSLVNDPSLNMLKNTINTPFEEIEELSKIKVHGSVFQAGRSIILIDSSSPLPKFAKILKIFYINQKLIGFYCQDIKTDFEDMELNAYKITFLSSKVAVSFNDMKFPHEVLLLKVEGKCYVVPRAVVCQERHAGRNQA
ncbi:Adducin-related protein 1 [Frankliniella fusca]|uniref:Adducin-related protein 1 n=1 Tax=Frankliniella fusca TaxID=407009 RepID=A0AAE1HK81_9NEOP|nr:Adducin-related protein 1 [Frankliniella fusca]KAK3926773.1 Adducin-related protein 1 [Frankliniella fusca]